MASNEILNLFIRLKKLLAGRQPGRLGDIPVIFDVFICLVDANGLGIGEEGAFENLQLGLCTKAQYNYKC